MVINYDIPWNPVRVIQRVGRINRISKKVFNSIYIVNFFPTEKGATLVKSREIAQQKMFLIHNTLGEDAKIFDVDEEPTPANLYSRIQQNPDDLETESTYTKLLREYLILKEKHPEIIEGLTDFPSRVKVGKAHTENELLVFYKKGRVYINGIKFGNEEKNEIQNLTIEDVYEKLKCYVDDEALSLSNTFWDNYTTLNNYKGKSHAATPEQSLEHQALVNLKSMIQKPWDEIMPYLNFLRTLRDDIIDFGTLSDFTHRRLSLLKMNNDKNKVECVSEIKQLLEELGEDYLTKEISKQKQLNKEVIIAVENQNNKTS